MNKMKLHVVILVLCLSYAYGSAIDLAEIIKRLKADLQEMDDTGKSYLEEPDQGTGESLTRDLQGRGYLEEPDQGIGESLTRDLQGRGVTPVAKVNTFKGGAGKPEDLSKMALFAHNEVRKKHGSAALSWDNNLAKSAEAWAKKIAAKGSIEHSPESKAGKYGENVAFKVMPFAGAWGPAFLVMLWYDEYNQPGFDFKDPENPRNKGAGHFTQLVWKETKKVGCGLATVPGKNGDDTYLVCQYLVGANMAGQYGANVADLAKGQSSPKNALELASEGCVDYGASTDECTKMKGFCTQYSFVKDACCDSCK